MSHDSPAPVEPSKRDVLQHLRELLGRMPPDIDQARMLVDSIEPSETVLRAKATRVLRFVEAPKSPLTAAQAPLSSSGMWSRLLSVIPGGWGTLAAAGVAAVMAALGYSELLPSLGSNPHAPDRAANPFPLPVPLFQVASPASTVTFQHGASSSLTALPMPDGIGIKDDLSKWDRRGMFHGAWAAPYEHQYFVDGCLLADNHYLYVGAEVGDPWPMQSKSPVEKVPDAGWKGGGIQLRFASTGWPVKASDPPESFYHMTIWHKADEKQDYLHIVRGRNLDKGVEVLTSDSADNSDFCAQFVPSKGGYQMRCRIAWKLLGYPARPVNHEAGMCWEVTWSDAIGQTFVGKYTDIFLPEKLKELATSQPGNEWIPGKRSYQNAEIWGKVKFTSPDE